MGLGLLPALPAIGSDRVPVEHFFGPAQFNRAALSPDGTALAALAMRNDRPNLVVIDLQSRKPQWLTNLRDGEVAWFSWINARRLVFDVNEHKRGYGQRAAYFGAVAIDRDGGRMRELPDLRLVRDGVALARDGAPSDEIVALMLDRTSYFEVFRVDTVTGRSVRLVERTPGRVGAWHIDHDGFPRAAQTWDGNRLRWALHYRRDADAPWQQFRSGPALVDERESIRVAAFDYDGTMIVMANPTGARRGLYWFDVERNALGPELATHPRYDVEAGLVFDPVKRKLVGVRVEAERPEFHWIDDDWARWHSAINRALPNRVNVLQRAVLGQTLMVYSYSDRDPGTCYLYDPRSRRLEPLLRRRPDIEPSLMGERRFLRYRARDGLEIPAYLTLPAGREPRNLPLVVLVHGGPFVRGETWGWDAEAHFLASRGYAVLQPEFRGSRGYGARHHQAGWKQWGRAMQDDLNDGVLHLAREGVVDAGRAGIMGSSYGGYAALMGVARDPDFWRCAVSFAGVTDLEYMMTAVHTDYAGSRVAEALDRQRVGDPATESERLREVSPVRLAHRIKRPVLLAAGGEDRRVPIEHATRMRAALQSAQVEHEWVFYSDEVHGFSFDAVAVDYYTRVERFLAKHLGN